MTWLVYISLYGINFLFYFFNFFKFIYLLKKFFLHLILRERQSTSGGGAEREGDTESKQAPGSELSAQSHPGAPTPSILMIRMSSDDLISKHIKSLGTVCNF